MVGAESHGTHAAGALAAADAGGAARVEDDHEGEQRAAGPGASGGGGAGGGAGAALRGGGTRGRVAERDDGQQPGAAVQSGRAWGAADRGRAWSAADVRRGRPRPDRGDGAAATGSEGGRDGDLVLEYPGADDTSGGTLGGRGDDDSAGGGRRGAVGPAGAEVGATTIRRVLRDAGSSYQRTRTWCPTGTAQRKRKAGVVRVVDPRTEEKRGPSTGRTG